MQPVRDLNGQDILATVQEGPPFYTPLMDLSWIAVLVASNEFKKALQSHWKDTRHLSQKAALWLNAAPLEKAAKQAIELFAEKWDEELVKRSKIAAALPGYRNQFKTLAKTTAAEIAEWMDPETEEVDLSIIKATWTELKLDPASTPAIG